MEPHEDKVCRICWKDVKNPTARRYDGTAAFQCWTCGDYEIVPDAYQLLFRRGAEQKRYLLSGRARMSPIETGQPHRFSVEDIQAMLDLRLRDKTYSESALSVMRWLAATGAPGTTVRVNAEHDYPVGYCRDAAGLMFVVGELREAGHLDNGEYVPPDQAKITGAGWQWLEAQIKEGTGQQAFIAMSFSPAMKAVEDALRAGVIGAGYHAVLVKDREFVDGIVDRVYAEVRQSRFVVADFTENNNGAYLEAGYGRGLGLTVIGTCEASQLDPASNSRVHFDVRGMNIIGWRRDNLADLTRRLTQRILALFPRGPVKPDTE